MGKAGEEQGRSDASTKPRVRENDPSDSSPKDASAQQSHALGRCTTRFAIAALAKASHAAKRLPARSGLTEFPSKPRRNHGRFCGCVSNSVRRMKALRGPEARALAGRLGTRARGWADRAHAASFACPKRAARGLSRGYSQEAISRRNGKAQAGEPSTGASLAAGQWERLSAPSCILFDRAQKPALPFDDTRTPFLYQPAGPGHG